MLNKNLEYFIQNQDALVKQHKDKFLVIKDCQIVGVYDTALQAYLQSKEQHKPGTFTIQPCSPGPDAYTIDVATSLGVAP